MELLGNKISLTKSLKPSDNGCKIPKKPITLGPRRLWIEPKIFRSTNVKYATAIKMGTTTVSQRAKNHKTLKHNTIVNKN